MMNDALDKKEQFFDLWAPNYDVLFLSVFYQAFHKRLLEYVDLPQRASVLDLGCGTGRLLNRLCYQFPQLRGTGLDLSAEMLRIARRQKYPGSRLIFIQGNAESLPFADRQFDAVFNTLSFLHYPKPKQVFSEVSRILQPGGHFYLVDPTFKRPTANDVVPVTPGGIRLYSKEMREQLGLQVGLSCNAHHYLLGSVLLTIFTKVRN